MRPALVLLVILAVAAPVVLAKAPADARVIYAEDAGHLAAGFQVTGVEVPGPHGEPLNVARVPFHVDDCHRHLRFMLQYDPRNASADADLVYAAVPFELALRLVDAETGERLPDGTMRVLTPGTYGYRLDASAAVVAEVWLVRGADVTFTLRVTGWQDPDAECRHQGRLFVNEVEADPPAGGAQWVEVLNAGWEDVDLTGWTLTAASGSALALEDVRVDVDAHAAIPLPAGFLDPAGDAVTLVAPRGWEVDATPVLADAAGDARTWQRSPDGADAWAFRAGTPGAGNG